MRPPHTGGDAAEVGALADRIAVVVAGCGLVAGLAEDSVATYLPGRAVHGVAIRDDGVEVAVVARFGPPLDVVAAQVRMAVAPLVSGRHVDVRIADLVLPGDAGGPAPETATGHPEEQ